MALRVPVLLFLLFPSVFCRPSSLGIIADGASTMIDSPAVFPRNVTTINVHLASDSRAGVNAFASTNGSEEGESGRAAERDGSSGAIISAASIGSVALVVVACGGCFVLGKRRKRPGFHMPTVLVDIESARDQPDSPSPTSVRPPWRDSVRKSLPPCESEGEPSHDCYPPKGASNSRPPSYASAKVPLPPGPSSQGHEAPG